MKLIQLFRSAWLLALIWLGVPATAQTTHQMLEPAATQTKRLYAVTNQNQTFQIGTVCFQATGKDLIHFDVALDMDRFKDFFLSMKEFKCLEGAEVSCHVPYPYNNPHTIHHGDLTWLEHSLLFLYKSPKDFGAKLWNGIYFQFEKEGDRLVGHAQAIDLNFISAPPDSQAIAPYTSVLRSDYPAGARWLDRLVIE